SGDRGWHVRRTVVVEPKPDAGVHESFRPGRPEVDRQRYPIKYGLVLLFRSVCPERLVRDFIRFEPRDHRISDLQSSSKPFRGVPAVQDGPRHQLDINEFEMIRRSV